MSDYEVAARAWAREVDEESANLIERGVPPWEAVKQATDIVSNRRRREVLERQMKKPPVIP